jgi:2-(1,2-epoxy-1,2-dihydrophenyl)acetyl-CoA isomerase
MEFERASLEIDGGVAILRMNDPDVLNAVSAEMLKGMSDVLDSLAASETKTRCLVLTGAAHSPPAPTCRGAAAAL